MSIAGRAHPAYLGNAVVLCYNKCTDAAQGLPFGRVQLKTKRWCPMPLPSLLQQKRRDRLLLLCGGVLGALAFFAVLGFSPLDVTNDAFCRGGFIEKDIQQHYAGWLFYRQSPLDFPLCVAKNINWPQGLSIAYTDSIPLFAAFFRLLEPLLPATFQYFGWFTLLCLVLQGAFGARLLGLFSKGLAAPLIGDVLLMFSPVLWERVLRHTSLAAQFFVVAALYYYFAGRRSGRYAYAGLFALNILTITIHPYFVPMTYAVTAALLLGYAAHTRRWFKPALWLAADFVLTVAAGWAFGLFYGTANGGSDALYGYFAMNLNSLWNPAGVGGVDWSLFLPMQNQVGGNYDAFAYLGAGVLAALALGLAVAVLQKRWHPVRLLRRHWPLALVCLVLTLFAVSHVITANGATLAVLPLPDQLIKLCSVFRSGGRMFWPVYYLLFCAAFVLTQHLPKGQKACVALAGILAAVQLADLAPGLYQRHEAFAQAQAASAYPTDLTSDFWQQAAGRYAVLASMDGIQNDALHLALYAADLGVVTTDPFAARFDAAALEQQREAWLEQLAQGETDAATLYLFADEGAFLQAVEPVSGGDAWCGRIDGAAGSWYVIAPGMADCALDESCVLYDDAYPLRLADYTDALWNRGVLDSTKQTVCFADAPFTRRKLENAAVLCADGIDYPILTVDDSDPGWLMVTLDIEDATVLWDKELETK